MKVLVITNLFFPDRGGGASVISDLCFELKARGWEVVVYTTHPYYPEWRRKDNASLLAVVSQKVRGVSIFRHGLYIPKNPSKLLPRLVYEVSFAISLLRSLLRKPKPDVTLVYCPLLGSVVFAAIHKAVWRTPLWLNIQDIPVEAASGTGISKAAWFNRVASWMERFLFNRADVWSTISPIMAERLHDMRARDQAIELIPNWLNSSMADEIAGIPSKLGRAPQQPWKLLYAGNIGKKQGLAEFCARLSATHGNFQFKIHGDGGAAKTIQEWLAATDDPRFAFGPFLDEAGFVRALYETDVFVITEIPSSGASFIPSKLIPCIATGTPVVAICNPAGPLGREVQEFQLGIVLPWESLSALPATLHGLFNDPERFEELQGNCLTRAREYNRSYVIPMAESVLQRLGQGSAV